VTHAPIFITLSPAAIQIDDGTRIYDLGAAERMKDIAAFVADPGAIRIRLEAGVDTERQ
jgi:hypothetical protein